MKQSAREEEWAAWLRLAMKGDAQAYNRFLVAVTPHLRSMARRRCDRYGAPASEAEDVVQEVFLKYLRGHPPFSDDDHEKAWLLRVTVNQCRDLLRRRKHRHHLPLEEAAAFCADTGTGEVTRQLLLLPRLYQVPLLLHYYEGYSVEEIGSVLRLSASAVKMRLKRGREKLREALSEEEEPE